MPLAPPSLATAAPVAREGVTAAGANFRANLAALMKTQPALVETVRRLCVDVTWLFARDGSLTAQDAAGIWWAGCSVPTAAARAMLKSLSGSGTVACFLRPPSAAALRVALDKLRRNQAVVAIVPDTDAAWVMLHCEDFAEDVRAHRLWLAIGNDWEAQLASLFRNNEGLPTPTQFVRLNDGFEELAETMIVPAQRVFSELTQERAASIARALEASPATGSTRACVVAPTHLRLWDDDGFTLAQLAKQLGWAHVDPDDPACASPLAMARSTAGCTAVIMPNTGRADLPNVVATATPWVTWLTSPRVPTFAVAGPRDALLVADPAWRDGAIAQGWPASRVHVATWPQHVHPPRPASRLLILADHRPLDPPKDVVEMSSHRLLWELIASELVRDPFALGGSILDYLHTRMAKTNIAADALDQRRFIDDLIAPAYARGLAELLHRAGLPLRLAGAGWESVESLAPFASGAIETREAFGEAVASCSALVHVWPTACAHPIDHAGRPVIRAGRGREPFLRDARLAAAGKLPLVPPATPSLSADLFMRLIHTC